VNVYFYRVSAEKNHGSPTCQVYIETNGLHITFLECGRYEKTLETNGRQNGLGSGAPAPPPWVLAPVALPIRLHLADPASTAFEDQ
jgi:hypothetical protein